MARDIYKIRSQSLLNKDFDGFKRDLLRFSDAFASGVIVDKSVPSSAMVMIELMSFIGDSLSFNIDQSFNELREDTASQIENVVQFAKMRGYRVKGNVPARGSLPVMLEVPAVTSGDGSVVPDPLYLPILSKGSRAQSRNGVLFETLDDIDYSSDVGRSVTGSLFAANGLPSHFAVREQVDIIAGQSKSESFPVTSFRAFRSIELSDQDISEIISVVDSDGNEWLEVDFLAQDWVFDGEVNTGDDSTDVPYTLKVVAAPRRFISEWNPLTRKTSITFGSGDGVDYDDELIPNVADYAIPLYGRRTSPGTSIDPRNFLKTRTLGLSPYNTTLTVTYRVGGGADGNVDPGSIDSMVKADLSFVASNLDSLKKADVEASVQCYNTDSTDGGMPEESIKEIKMNSAAYFAAQDRCVTRSDVIARILSLPAKYGRPAKVYVKTDDYSSNAIDVYILAQDSENHIVTPSATLKRNIATYINQYRMLTDGFNIFDGTVINMRCNFGIVVSPTFNKSETLTRCINALTNYFSNEDAQIARPFVRSEVSSLIQAIDGVVSVYELSFSNVFGTVDGLTYSSARYDFQDATRNGIIYCPSDSVFELKYPRRDISGVAK
jgi:hypothetical protein